jgi:streptogramin lyase
MRPIDLRWRVPTFLKRWYFGYIGKLPEMDAVRSGTMTRFVSIRRLAAVLALTATSFLLVSSPATGAGLESPYLAAAVNLPGLRPTALAATTDGSLWFSAVRSRSIASPTFGRIGPDGGVTIIAYESVAPLLASSGAVFWLGRQQIEGETTAGESFRLPPPRDNASQALLAVAADGTIWYRRETRGRGGRWHAEIDRLQGGRLTARVRVPAQRRLQTPVLASDGSFWVVDAGPVPSASTRVPPGHDVPAFTPTLLRITPIGERSRFPLPGDRAPGMLAAGPNGAIFLTESRTRPGSYQETSIERVSASGELHAVILPKISEISSPVFGPGGDLWFLTRQEAGPEEIDSMTPGGVLATPTCVDPTCDLDAGILAADPLGDLFVSATLGYGGSGGGGTGLVGLEASEAAGAILGRFLPPAAAIAVEP